MSIKKLSYMLLSALSLAALMNGCGSSSKEGGTGSVASVSEGTCIACHSNQKSSTSGKSTIEEYAVSSHNPANVSFAEGCQGCHGGGASHNGVGPFEWPNPLAGDRCIQCHTPAHTTDGNTDLSALFTVAKTDGFVKNCAPCHTASGNGSAHAVQTIASLPNPESCVDCHDVAAPQHGANRVNDNNGVRAIVGEFGKWSHHVTGRAVTNADCAVCHLEGKASGAGIVTDPAYHMADNKTHLRNANATLTGNQTTATVGAGGQSEYAWNPTTPDHTLMDQFCMSCHNGAGAKTAVAALTGVAQVNPATPRSAINPFGDSISNAYDQAIRPGVVAVFEQFDTGNTSHHAVRGQRYTTTTLPAGKITEIVANNNTAAYLASLPAAPNASADVRNTLTLAGLTSPLLANTANDIDGAAGTLTFGSTTTPPFNSPTGFIGTLFETGKFITAYTTLGTANTIKDTTQNHCGDCHSVGQFSAADVGVAPFNNAVIGAHGSNNEYMLRNSNGTDVTTPQALVCFICHADAIYGNFGHEGTNSADADCNGDNYNVAGTVGAARLMPDEGALTDAAFQAELAAGTYRGTGGGNIFAIKCINCHNSSDEKRFGGIHGNAKHDGTAKNTSYKTYSSATTPNAAFVLVDRKPYRFLPGLGNFRYNGGHNEEAWTRKVITNASRQGCYTLTGFSATGPAPNPSPTSATASGANISSRAIAGGGDNGILGSWGACTDHGGSSFTGSGRSTTRTNLRPLTY